MPEPTMAVGREELCTEVYSVTQGWGKEGTILSKWVGRFSSKSIFYLAHMSAPPAHSELVKGKGDV